MLKFLPAIFNPKHKYKNRYKAYPDFSQIFLSEFDDVYCEYRRTNQEYEKEYPFRFIPLDANMLERELRNCLTLLISLSPVKNNTEKTEIMWQACRLSELHHNMVDLFSEEIMKKICINKIQVDRLQFSFLRNHKMVFKLFKH